MATNNPAEFQRMLGFYTQVEQASREMLVAARLADWDQVAEIVARCAAPIRELRRLNLTLALNRDERKTKLRVMRQIIRNEAQVRRLASPWNDRYERLLLGHAAAITPTGLVV
jgi:flagellar protein FliT